MNEISYDELMKDKIVNYIASRCFFGQDIELFKYNGYGWVTAEQVQKYENEIKAEIKRRKEMIREKMTEVDMVKEIVFNIRCGVTNLEYLKENGSSAIFGMGDISAEQIMALEDKIVSELERQSIVQEENIAKFLKDCEENPEKYSDIVDEEHDYSV